MRSVVIHAHFYQPPREDPWTDRVPREFSAQPFHDWNERVLAECYRPVTEARLLSGDGRIRGMVNTLDRLSWDAGPTLLRWMAREAPDTYRAFIEADARSIRRLGHGNALAAPFHHVILPLASRRDKITEVRWGIADFRRRFGREPEGMWLPETAVDMESLEVLAGEGIRFTILAPHQVRGAPPGGAPGRVDLPGGRSIVVFPYDGDLSHGVAFGRLLKDSEGWVRAIREAPGEEGVETPTGERSLLTIATDGETFGHHHRWGDMALAATVERLVADPDLRLENPAAYLAQVGTATPVELVEETSWSCAHGIERWRRECGCRMDSSVPPAQGWREPLRAGLEELAGGLRALYEKGSRGWAMDPWEARDRYGPVVDLGPEARRRFAREVLGGERSAEARDAAKREGEPAIEQVLRLLEMERDALRMFTSCGWFFDDIGGLEPLQVLRYAAHALELAGDAGAELEPGLLRQLERARSSDPEVGDGARVWREVVRGGETAESGETDSPDAAPTRPTVGPGPLVRAVRDLRLRPEAMEEALRAVESLTDEASGGSGGSDAAGGEIRAAQSALWHVVEDLLPREREPLAPLLEALGFSREALRTRSLRATAPLPFVFGIHLHQPVGNFDEVFQEHSDQVYEPLLRVLEEAECLPVALHVSGPLLEWLDARSHPLLDRVGRLAADGRVELLLSGFYEPILPVLDPVDRLAQIEWMRDWLHRKLGVEAGGLWLTERVWEPDLARDLADAGVRYVFLDDWHFGSAVPAGTDLHRPFRTEWGGRGVEVLPIDERLRYLVPFRPPEELAEYLSDLRAAGRPAAILADDGEKFGGWPGTAEWVWESGWMERFLETLRDLRDRGEVELVTPSRLLATVPSSGPIYLPSGSYREMEEWAGGPERGGHWRNFLSRYPESNRMYRKTQWLSRLCRERGDPVEARRRVGMAQCNDAYWHGVFGGLYLRHLREAIWSCLAEAEGGLREGEGMGSEVADHDGDGLEEIRVHGARFSALVAPHRGGGVEELVWFEQRRNAADTLTRRREPYHLPSPVEEREEDRGTAGDGGMPSIHDRERALSFEDLPPADREPRALLVDRVLPAGVDPGAYEAGRVLPVRCWARRSLEPTVDSAAVDRLVVELRCEAPGYLTKRLSFHEDGAVGVDYLWDPAEYPADAVFAPEISLDGDVKLVWDAAPAKVLRYEIRTLSKSEAGSEETVQGISLTPLWPAAVGEASFVIRPGPARRASAKPEPDEPRGEPTRAPGTKE